MTRRSERENSTCSDCANWGYIDYPNNTRPCNCWRGKLEQIRKIGDLGSEDKQ